ncbi:MAG: transposase [Coprococcus phoceensis]
MISIKRLIRHIPEKHFKMIRYGGLYARHRKTDEKLIVRSRKANIGIYRSFNQWRTAILLFGYDPLECPNCKQKMELWEPLL